MDELKIAAGIICAAMFSRDPNGQTDLKADHKETIAGYWKIYDELKTHPDNPENKKTKKAQ